MGTKHVRKHEINFTKRALEALEPPESGRVYWYDTKQANLAICITSAGSRSLSEK